jgi:hypothetical protein
LIRKFDKGKLFTIDDETYEKLTIEIRNLKIGVPITLGSGDIRFYYSTGSCGFIYKGHGLYSTDGSGEITINKVKKNKILANIDLSIVANPAGTFPFEGKRIQIRETLIFDEIRITDLTPWLGVPNPSLGKEVYP